MNSERLNQILHALSRDGEGIQITLLPDGQCVLDFGYAPYNRFVGPNLESTVRDAARKAFEVCFKESAVWRELVGIDANGYFF